jgi:hypothetical protein
VLKNFSLSKIGTCSTLSINVIYYDYKIPQLINAFPAGANETDRPFFKDEILAVNILNKNNAYDSASLYGIKTIDAI